MLRQKEILMRCTVDTNKPLIAILLALYEPRMEWLKELLESLNAQTYPSLILYVRDDASAKVPYEAIKTLIEKSITAFPYIVNRNENNLGSNKTFELLTREARGEYFAYCDQDDIWETDKLYVLKEGIKDSTMIYSDISVIDKNGDKIADSLKNIRPRLNYVYGDGLAETYFFRNCTAGCSMMVRSEMAQEAIPFPKDTVYDHWISIISATKGSISFIDKGLVKYRQHENNQTGILKGIKTKNDYYTNRVAILKERLSMYQRITSVNPDLVCFIESRINRKIGMIWRYRAFSPIEAKFEILLKFLPDSLFMLAQKTDRIMVNLKRKG